MYKQDSFGDWNYEGLMSDTLARPLYVPAGCISEGFRSLPPDPVQFTSIGDGYDVWNFIRTWDSGQNTGGVGWTVHNDNRVSRAAEIFCETFVAIETDPALAPFWDEVAINFTAPSDCGGLVVPTPGPKPTVAPLPLAGFVPQFRPRKAPVATTEPFAGIHFRPRRPVAAPAPVSAPPTAPPVVVPEAPPPATVEEKWGTGSFVEHDVVLCEVCILVDGWNAGDRNRPCILQGHTGEGATKIALNPGQEAELKRTYEWCPGLSHQ